MKMKLDKMEFNSKPEIHPKGWGYEIWIYNSDLYCGKILNFEAGKKCSWHYHILKDEVFYVRSGRIELLVSEFDEISEARVIRLGEGDTYHVRPGIRHQMKALIASELVEISTTHFESDSYRLLRGD
jgi:quercetin dioxygenase-like cupin family protein